VKRQHEATRQDFYAGVEQFATWYMAQNPVAATEMGVHHYDDRLAIMSEEGIETARGVIFAYGRTLEVYDAGDDLEWEIDLRLMRALAQAQLRIYDEQDLPHRSPDFYGAEALFGPYSLLMKDFAPLSERLRNLVGRLADVPRVLGDAERNLGVCPRLWVEIAIESTEGGLALFQSLIPALAEAVSGDEPILAARITATNTKAMAAVERYISWLRETLLPRAAGDFAVGEVAWNRIVRDEHMLDLDAAAIEAIGWDLIRETEAALETEAAAICARENRLAASWQDLLAEVRADHPTVDDLVPAYQAAMEASRAFVVDHDLVTLPPDEHLHIVETPGMARPLYPFAGYVQPGAFETKQLGLFWVTPVPAGLPPAETEILLRGHPHVKIPIMAVHEGYPGHHVQLSRANAVKSLPRKLGTGLANLLIEGWAFYCEEMMEAEGFLADPRGRLMRLAEQLWRACRIVIDVGLHCRAMTAEQAIALLVERARLEPPNARAEVQRYSQSPTQPMSYLMGKREIMRLAADWRARETAAGRPFALKPFHDALLDCGSLPPRLLRLALFGRES
jgi:uncharacterized protein (DUF885 family)